jgi:hypothetical protein
MFCALGLIFGGTEGVGSRFHVLRSRTHFRRYQGRRLPFSFFARTDLFSTVPRASGLVFKFCAPGLIFCGTEGVRSRFHVLCSRTCFRPCRVRRVPFPCFVLPDSFSAVPRASSPVFRYCASVLVFGCTKGVGSRFHVLHSRTQYGDRFRINVLRSRTRFRRYRGRRVPFSCFACPDSFSAETRASGPIFKLCATRVISRGTMGVGIPFSCFAHSDSFSEVPRASGPGFIFCAPGLIFGGIEGVGSHFHVLRSRTRFRH